jgi:hypothetical protein
MGKNRLPYTKLKLVEKIDNKHQMDRVLHRYGHTRGFWATGPMVTGTVSDFSNRMVTVPVTAVPRYTTYTPLSFPLLDLWTKTISTSHKFMAVVRLSNTILSFVS